MRLKRVPLCWALAALLTLAVGSHAAESAAEQPAPNPAPSSAAAPQSLDLPGGVTLDLVPIDAGSFDMGAIETIPESPMIGFGIFLVGLAIVVGAILFVCARALIFRERPRFSLATLLIGVLALGAAGVGGMRWRSAARAQFSNSALAHERPRHSVQITRPFLMGKFCVTQEQFAAVMKGDTSFFKDPHRPTEQVSWDEAMDFCKRVSAQSQRTVRLPTEAEWEYACRAGKSALYSCGNDERELLKTAWLVDNSKNSTHTLEETARTLKPNDWKLYDMEGNVMQWCQDWYDERYYANFAKSPAVDPKGPEQGYLRVIRGSSWLDPTERCRASARNSLRPGKRSYSLGFRVVVEK